MQRTYQNLHSASRNAENAQRISERLACKTDIVDAEFEIIYDDGDTPHKTANSPAKSIKEHGLRTANSDQFFSQPVRQSTFRTTPNRVAFYTISAGLVIFTFWWTGGYILMAPNAHIQSAQSKPVTQSHNTQDSANLDNVTTSAIASQSDMTNSLNPSSIEKLPQGSLKQAGDGSIETLDGSSQIEKSKSSFIFATGTPKGSHRSLQFQPSF